MKPEKYRIPKGCKLIPHGTVAIGRGPNPDDFILVRKSDAAPVESAAAFHARVRRFRDHKISNPPRNNS